MDNKSQTLQAQSLQQIEKKGQEIYDTKLRNQLEPYENGKYVVIDIETEDHFVADSLDEALTSARQKYPNHLFHTVKIGSPGVYKVSGLTANENNRWLY